MPAEPAPDDVEALQAAVRQRVLRAFERRGWLERADRVEMEHWHHGGGFSLDALVSVAGGDRRGRERLLRSCARPAFAAERLEWIDAHRVRYRLPKPRPDGRSELILSAQQLIEGLVALLPPPRPPLVAPARDPPAWDIDARESMQPHGDPAGTDPLAQPEPDDIYDQRITWSDPNPGADANSMPRLRAAGRTRRKIPLFATL